MAGFYVSLIRAAALSLLLLTPAARAADAPHPGGRPTAAPAPAETAALRLPPDAVTHHTITLGGKPLAYTATAGSLTLRDRQGAETAQIFYVAFTLDGGAEPAHRPITYVFNGGPRAAAAYLDIGALGPRALDFGAAGKLPPASDRVADNPDTWLPFTDLVFVDPVGTGWSRAVGGSDAAAKKFWGVKPDLDSLAAIIRRHLTESGRLASPVYLVGESYGGFRVAHLAYDLARGPGIAPAGVVMISPVLEFALMTDDPLDPLPWALRLPSYAATAMAEKGAGDPGALAAVEHFAMTDYLTALAAGPPPGAAAEALYAKLAQLTGLNAAQIARWRGRIPLRAYLKDARRGEGEIVSSYDATVAAPDPDPWSDFVRDDPLLDATIAPFTRAFVDYARGELGFRTNLPYALLDRTVSRRWDWSEGRQEPVASVGAEEALRRALTLEPRLKVMIAHGRTDVLTPYMTSRYVVDHLPPGVQARVALKLYDGGHMMYLRAPSRHRLHDDAKAFYGAAPVE